MYFKKGPPNKEHNQSHYAHFYGSQGQILYLRGNTEFQRIIVPYSKWQNRLSLNVKIVLNFLKNALKTNHRTFDWLSRQCVTLVSNLHTWKKKEKKKEKRTHRHLAFFRWWSSPDQEGALRVTDRDTITPPSITALGGGWRVQSEEHRWYRTGGWTAWRQAVKVEEEKGERQRGRKTDCCWSLL